MEASLNARFNQNLQQIARQQPIVAMRLAQMVLEQKPVHRLSAKQLAAWLKQLSLDGVKVLYVYGLGAGEAYEALSPWLHARRQRSLVFLEDDPRVLHQFLDSDLASRMLCDRQVRVYAFDRPEADQPLFNQLAWDYNLQPMAVTASKAYAGDRAERFAILKDRLIHEHHSKGEFAQEYLDQGIVFYQNFYANMLQLSSCRLGDGLFGQFKGVPAIICGAGPSLNKQIPMLKELKDKALIFSGGSALNALSHAGLWPHFGCGIDPNMLQLRRLKDQLGNEVPFFFRSRMNHRAFKMIHGERLYVTGTGGYETARYFERCLGLPFHEIDEGHNVVNFSASLAQAMGCNPIIFVGLDLAFTGMQTYAGGVVADPSVSKEMVARDGVLRSDIYGKPIYTQWKWIDESKWITDFAEQHPKTRFLNATEGGLGMEGVSNVIFAEIVRDKLKHSWDLDGLVWATIQQSSLPKDTGAKINGAMHDLRTSLECCQTLIEQLMLSPSPGAHAFFEANLEQEVAFGAILSTFCAFSLRMQSRERQWLAWTGGSDQSLDRKHYAFLRKVVRTHIALIDYAIIRHKEPVDSTIVPISRKNRKLKISSALDGESMIWNAEGTLLSKTEYRNGLCDGLCQRFYPNAQLAMEGAFSKGKPSGVHRYYYPNGSPKTVIDHETGKIKLYRR